MSYVSGKRIASGIFPCVGAMLCVFGFFIGYLFPFNDPISLIIGNSLLAFGVAMVLIGMAIYPGGAREAKRIRSILEIVAVRKEVTISDISAETGLDREYIRKVITDLLIANVLFGYLEDDLFVRDTSGRPPFYGAGRFGFGGVSG